MSPANELTRASLVGGDGDDVEEHEAVDRLFPAVEAGELAALEQLLRQTLSEKSCAAGDENFH